MAAPWPALPWWPEPPMAAPSAAPQSAPPTESGLNSCARAGTERSAVAANIPNMNFFIDVLRFDAESRRLFVYQSNTKPGFRKPGKWLQFKHMKRSSELNE